MQALNRSDVETRPDLSVRGSTHAVVSSGCARGLCVAGRPRGGSNDWAVSLRGVGVAGGVGCGLGGGVVAEADSDRLVVAALFGVDKVG
jgi:hypothetical protein